MRYAAASSADMPPQDDHQRILEAVRHMLEGFADTYRRFGLRVTGVEADRDDDDAFPHLLLYVEDERVEGERVARYSLEHNGHLMGPGDAAETVAMWILESAPAGIRRLPLSRRVSGGSADG